MASSPHNVATAEMAERNARLGKWFIGVIVGMFLLGFASIPLYRWVCAQTDPGGSAYFNGEADSYEGVVVDESRQVRVRFATNVERQLPWSFDVGEKHVTVHPGEKRLVSFTAFNEAPFPIKGKAVYDINPPEAAPYFKKIECFCFVEQTIDGESKYDMPLLFWFDPELPEHVTEVTLAYTFFSADSSMTRASREY
ncbi:cytochrome c oxidase assembly protein [Bradymonadaceae bacterium TMQ3]|uniref:Cytochrome c oxidase assembly protein CtaG n=1 Tax=Lujinxingia sediminis TaxID=2480984 RepID=A0ABY0CSG2_9DELT|nr:cytochrome c oxidase assembly protein [Lujinxingia sediminis]RDV38829.1 cytochrome c oxidase assembly protein [Bradymonadaceae bacterium TMQ3]RVU44063.1 cytochrome c oxidase assembly protein [Lujinxingia sediminis]TXC76399.1 cytochrome c oxidase assembly protein [Bradymonadales bacterium TMQ1]